MLQAVRQVQLPVREEPVCAMPSRGEEVLQALASMQRAMDHDFQVRLTREVESARAELIGRLEELRREIDRVNALLQTITKEIDAMLNDPGVELSRIMRQKSEQTVLRAYLEGLQYAAGAGRFPTVSLSAG